MKNTSNSFKNIDKSAHMLIEENNAFKVLYFNNLTDNVSKFQIELSDNYIQLYFCTENIITVAFNMEHCAITLKKNDSSMVYFKDDTTNVFYTLPQESQLTVVLISLDFFHSLFSEEGNFLFNFKNFKIGQPIIETKEIESSVQLILNQLVSIRITDSLRPIYLKGKVYELISYYFNTSTETNNDHCPYVANEDVFGKIKNAKEIIIDQMNNPPGLVELAKQVGLNIKKLKSGFKEYYGLPVFTFLLNYKMELAKKLLQEQQLNVNEIASQLGYSTSSHFIAAFKRTYGITPKQFAIS
ncbi:MAG: AraC family transcriptional activator of pyochelin receptor [Flavobacteriaceae bacterium]|jgi:AraC-like DNA-binding protein|uniref:helix-turn-helix transcriptional regulator n=1 Tax=Candidatus Marifrigoribacter sp. Uisw_064 TaxID=3230970 RepID=UPI003ADA7703